MAQTPGGLPYPVGTDKVVDGDDAIRALAEAIETNYGPAGAATSQTMAIPILGPSANTDTAMRLVPWQWQPPRAGLARVYARLDMTISNGAAGYAGAAVVVNGVVQDATYMFPAGSGANREMVEPQSIPFRVSGVGTVLFELVCWVYNPAGSWTVNSGISHWFVEVS